MSTKIRIAPGIEVTVSNHRIVMAATCGDVAHAEKMVVEFADRDPDDVDHDPTKALGFEQVVAFREWRPSLPSGWHEAEVLDA